MTDRRPIALLFVGGISEVHTEGTALLEALCRAFPIPPPPPPPTRARERA